MASTEIHPILLTQTGVAPTTGQALVATSTTAAAWGTPALATSATTATTATNIAGGVIGDIAVQSAAGTTTFIAPNTAGYVLTDNGTGAAPTFQAAAGGATLPIGTIVEGPSAPTGTGTWAATNGAVLTQSSYTALYSAIGHGFMGYTTTVPTTAVTNPWTGNPYACQPIWNGTYFCWLATATSMAYTTGGGTVSTVTVTSSSNLVSYNTGNTMLAYGSATSADYSANSGVTWAANTLPITPTAGSVAPGNSTTQYLYVNTGGTSVYTMAAGAGTWTTTASALSTAIGSLGAIWWDGTNWNIVDVSNNSIWKTSVASGKSGWAATATYLTQGFPGTTSGNRIACLNNGVNTLILYGESNSVVVSTSSFTVASTTLHPTILPIAGNNNFMGGVFWNGYCYVAVVEASGIIDSFYTSLNGTLWNQSMNSGLLFSGVTLAGSYWNNQPICNSSGQFIRFAYHAGDATVDVMLCSPTPTPATQFQLPLIPYSWIRTL